MIYRELPQTKTRQKNNSQWAFLAVRGTDPGGNTFYSVTTLEFAGRSVTRRIVSRYLCEPVVPEARLATVAFLVGKTHHTGDLDTAKGRESAKRVGEVYRCEVGPKFHRCTCVGGGTELARPDSAPCVHVLFIRGMVEEGELGEDMPAVPTGRTDAVSGEWDGHPPPADWLAEAAGGRLCVEAA